MKVGGRAGFQWTASYRLSLYGGGCGGFSGEGTVPAPRLMDLCLADGESQYSWSCDSGGVLVHRREHQRRRETATAVHTTLLPCWLDKLLPSFLPSELNFGSGGIPLSESPLRVEGVTGVVDEDETCDVVVAWLGCSGVLDALAELPSPLSLRTRFLGLIARLHVRGADEDAVTKQDGRCA